MQSKTWTHCLLLLLLCFISSALCGCGGDDEVEEEPVIDSSEQLIGTWELETIDGSALSTYIIPEGDGGTTSITNAKLVFAHDESLISEAGITYASPVYEMATGDGEIVEFSTNILFTLTSRGSYVASGVNP